MQKNIKIIIQKIGYERRKIPGKNRVHHRGSERVLNSVEEVKEILIEFIKRVEDVLEKAKP